MKIIILDFANGAVHVYPYDENIFDNVEDWFESEMNILGLKETNCQYMAIRDLTINIH